MYRENACNGDAGMSPVVLGPAHKDQLGSVSSSLASRIGSGAARPRRRHHKVRRTTSSCPSWLPSSSWLASRSPPFPRGSSGAPRQKRRRCRPTRRDAWLERASHSSNSFRGMRQTRPTRTAGMRDGSASSTAPSRRKMVVGCTRSRRATSSVVRNSSSEVSRSARGPDIATAAPALCAL